MCTLITTSINLEFIICLLSLDHIRDLILPWENQYISNTFSRKVCIISYQSIAKFTVAKNNQGLYNKSIGKLCYYSLICWNCLCKVQYNENNYSEKKTGTIMSSQQPTWWRNSPVSQSLSAECLLDQLHARTCTGNPNPLNTAVYWMQTLEPSQEASHWSCK